MLVLRRKNELVNQFDEMLDYFDSIFNNMFFSSTFDTDDFIKMREEYNKENKEHSITIAVPGYTKEDISVEIKDDIMKISGKIKNEKAKSFYSSESFCHSRKIKNLDPKTVNVTLKDGLLSITYKLKEELQTDTIKIEIT